ncbi:hypothetical protein [Bacillus sp. FJAT-44742]|uniref:hypothetical protein n=1 Tax=Bacillus sp. FJAT-44742 TaxID=2014005 RepID=UPI0012FEFB83|nr:hypothetical protein [Bacillus sp. FJAT-44742]
MGGSDNPKRDLKTLLFDTTFLVAGITALSYFCAYSYEKGYKKFYGINYVFISDI